MNKVKGSFLVKAFVHIILFLLGFIILIGTYNIFSYLDSYSTSTATFTQTQDFQSKYLKYVERVAVYVDYKEHGYTGSVEYDSLDLSSLFDKEEAKPDPTKAGSGQKDFTYYNAILNNNHSNFLYFVKNLKTGAIYCSPRLEKEMKKQLKMKDTEKALDAYLESVQSNQAYFILNTETERYATNVNKNFKFLNDENLRWVIDYIKGNYTNLSSNSKKGRGEYIICTSIVNGFPSHDDDFGKMNDQFNELHNNYMISIYPVPISFAFLLLFFVLAVTLTGHKKNVEGIVLTIFDRLYTEIGFGIVITGIIALLFFSYSIVGVLHEDFSLKINFLMLFAYTMMYPFCMFGLLSFIRRCKANVLFSNSLLCICFRKTVTFIKDFFKQRSLTYRVAGIMLIFVLVQLLAFYLCIQPMYSKSHNDRSNTTTSSTTKQVSSDNTTTDYVTVYPSHNTTLRILLFFVIIVLDYAFLFYVFLKPAIDYNILRKETKLLTEGDLNHKIEITNMCTPARALGEYINNIGDGFSSAVDEKLKSERLKTELITNVSHDIKTPLTSIINYVDLLKKEKIENETATEYLEVLSKKSWRLKTLIEDLVEASKASSGSISMNLECLNLVELVRQSMGEFEDRFISHNLETVLNVSNEPIYIMADGRSTYRIIENIFSNVNKYALSGTRIYVDITAENEISTVSVKNVSAIKLNMSGEELLERFVRGDLSRNTEGSGLGLSIAKSLASLQDAKFEIILDGDLFKAVVQFKRLEQPTKKDVEEIDIA